MAERWFRIAAFTRIGVIADTHGLLRPQALALFQGVDRIIHAGDVGDPTILTALRAIAPVVAIRGNKDVAPWAHALPETELVQCHSARIYVIHNLKRLGVVPHQVGINVVISGHSHHPRISTKRGVLYIDPGSAGPRRLAFPITCAILTIYNSQVAANILSLGSETVEDPKQETGAQCKGIKDDVPWYPEQTPLHSVPLYL